MPELDAVQREVLRKVVAKFPHYWDGNDPSITWENRTKVWAAMTRLELAGCVEKGELGIRATMLGRRTAAS